MDSLNSCSTLCQEAWPDLCSDGSGVTDLYPEILDVMLEDFITAQPSSCTPLPPSSFPQSLRSEQDVGELWSTVTLSTDTTQPGQPSTPVPTLESTKTYTILSPVSPSAPSTIPDQQHQASLHDWSAAEPNAAPFQTSQQYLCSYMEPIWAAQQQEHVDPAPPRPEVHVSTASTRSAAAAPLPPSNRSRRVTSERPVNILATWKRKPEEDEDEDEEEQEDEEEEKGRYIKKPLNAFMLFLKDQRKSVEEELGVRTSAVVNKVLGRRWKSMSAKQKQQYHTEAKRESFHHQLDNPGWTSKENYGMRRRRSYKKAKVTPHGRYADW